MEKLIHYRRLITQYIGDLATIVEQQRSREGSMVETQCAFDEQRDQYLLLNIGWREGKRVRGMSLYVRIKNGKIWIEDDMTEDGIANRLMEAGVPKEDIVLAFQPPEARRHTDFAVA
jgi:hypothetical protein